MISESKKKYVHLVFISSDWVFFHRKRFIRTIADRFSEWTDVILIQPSLSISVHLFTKFKSKILAYFTGKNKYNEVEKGIKLFTPFIFFHHLFWSKVKFFKSVDVFLLSRQINKLIIKKQQGRKVILWMQIPENFFLVKKVNYDYLVYDYYDNHIYSVDGELLKHKAFYNQELIKKCDLVICTAIEMYNQASKFNKNSLYLPNANNAGDIDFIFDENIHTEISTIKEPIIGYIGNIRNWIDFNLIEYLLNELIDVKIVFVGLIDKSAKNNIKKLKKYKNFILTGNKPLELVPYYLKLFNVGIIPFKLTKFTEGVLPNKFFEYITANIPVVTTNLPDFKFYKEYIGISETYEKFLINCKAAIKGEFKDKVKMYPKLALENTWDKRVEVLAKAYKDKLGLEDIIE